MPTANESSGILTVADAMKRDANSMITGSPEDDAYLGSLAVSAALICQEATVPIPPAELRLHYAPALELFVIYFVMALVLAFRPRGLFSLAEPRRI